MARSVITLLGSSLLVVVATVCTAACSSAPAAVNNGSPPTPAGTPPVCTQSGGVRVDEVIKRTFERPTMESQLKKKYELMQRDLEADQAMLTKEQEDLEKQANVLSKEALAERTKVLQKKLMALQAKLVRDQEDLDTTEKTMTAMARERVRSFVTARGAELAGKLFAIADDEKTTLWVAPGCDGAWVAPSVDLTDKVVERYEATHGGAPGETKM